MKVKTYNLQSNVEQEELDAGLLAESYVVEITDGRAMTLPSMFESETVSYTHLTLPTIYSV